MTEKQNSVKKKDTHNISVAILAEEPFFWGSRKFYHEIILNGYAWKTDDTIYEINTTYLYDKDIIKGALTKSNFDLLLVPGGGVGNNESLLKGVSFVPSVKKFKHNIRRYIQEGGGYLGICGGAALITGLIKGDGKKPTTITERLYNKSCLHVSCVTSFFKNLAFPLFYPFQYQHPEHVGNSAYAFSYAPGRTKDGKYIHTTGCCLDIHINHNNPLFSTLDTKTLRMRWWAGQALQPSQQPDRELYILAHYPPKDVSEDDTTIIVKQQKLHLHDVPIFTFYLAGPGESTKKIIHLNQGNKPCITAEIYPNEHKGRILLSTLHAEYMIWHGGHIQQVTPSKTICIGSGFHQWNDIEPLSDTYIDEITCNWWILRRFVAWVAKVPDHHLPTQENGIVPEKAEKIKEIIKKNIVWDGTAFHQMKNI